MATIVIIDDEPQMVNIVKILLSRDGHEIVTFFGAEEALDYLVDHPPHLIMSDNFMPGLSGFEMCQRILDIPQLQQIPVVIMTAYPTVKNEPENIPTNVRHILLKPFSPKDVRKIVAKMLDNPA